MTESPWIAPGEQGFLVGETLYLRPLEQGDAKYPGAWHFASYPINRQRAEELLTKELPKEAESHTRRLVACRRSDDTPVGAVKYEVQGWRTAFVQLRADPRLRPEGAAIRAEMLRIVVPWLSEESHNMVVWAELDAPAPAVIAAVEGLGMRPAARLREAIWRDGARHDQWVYELPHPGWVEKLGDPGPGIERAGEPPAATPAVRRVSLADPGSPVPEGALLVGERVALRMSEPDDWKRISRLARRETETFFDRGRWLGSPLDGLHWVKESVKQVPPKEVLLSVIQRETGELIGEVLLLHVDMFHRTAETGSMIYVPELRGQGIGSEAKLLLLEFAFDLLGLHMVRSFVWGPNTRSQAALRKQGYRDAGRLHWDSTAGAEFVDVVMFDLLSSEWRQRVNRAEELG
ncbi:MAG: GNAT family N-acetyltransferase [Chloroflexia bacterium]|nr:GNAT family N-acetyltransferase [Chloroflexia bacterium]MDQ3411124.1 GNAT family N-acetyltransferase [Chloroflexota bacterium]